MASVLILPDISALWPGRKTPTWTEHGIQAMQQWLGAGDQLIYVGSPDFTMAQLATDESGFNHAWTHWTYRQAKNGLIPNVMVAHNSVHVTTVHAFGPQFVESEQQITVFIADKEDFDACDGKPQQLSLMWRNLLEGYFDVKRWQPSSMLMGNLYQTVHAERFSRVIVLDEIQGRLVPTIVTVPAAP